MRLILGLAATIVAALCVRPARAVAQQTEAPSVSTQPEKKEETTADALLRELRRKRPEIEIIPPASAPGGVWPIARPKLLPEGAVLVERTGHLESAGNQWRFVFDPPAGPADIGVLPNTQLEIMVRTVSAASERVYFVVSGDITVFRDSNYLLVRFARRAAVPTESKAGTSSSPEAEESAGESAQRVADAGGATTPPSTPPSAEQTLSRLQAQQPRDVLMPDPGSTTPRGLEFTIAAGPTLRPEGATLVNRPGRVLREGDWWTFVFESDHPDQPEPPMKLLPSRGVEMMADAARQGDRGLVFLVSGEVTVFMNENYLFPTLVIRRIDTGNLRP